MALDRRGIQCGKMMPLWYCCNARMWLRIPSIEGAVLDIGKSGRGLRMISVKEDEEWITARLLVVALLLVVVHCWLLPSLVVNVVNFYIVVGSFAPLVVTIIGC